MVALLSLSGVENDIKAYVISDRETKEIRNIL